MSYPEVACQVSTAIDLLASQPLTATTLDSAFKGLMGQLGLNLKESSEAPLSQREGFIEWFC